MSKDSFSKVLTKNVAMFSYVRALRIETSLSLDKCVQSYIKEFGEDDKYMDSFKTTYQRMQKIFLTTDKQELF